jgi:Plastocyanin
MISFILRGVGTTCLLIFLFACNNPQEKPVSPPENQEDTTSKNTTDNTVSQAKNEHTHIIEISKMQFNPAELTIPKGDTVEWINNDLTNHCVTEVNKAWTSTSMEPTKTFKKVITKNTDYFCAIHLVMKGKIIVQ